MLVKCVYVGESNENYKKGDVITGSVKETFKNVLGTTCYFIQCDDYDINVNEYEWTVESIKEE